MAKQTMGVPVTAYQFRSDNKMFRLTYGQRPMVRTQTHRKYEMDNYPNGLNAVVAVLAYTGYDMEDAMIINKGSYDRGIAQASVYYSLTVDLRATAQQMGYEATDLYFDNSDGPHRNGPIPPEHAHIDEDGLPKIGTMLRKGDPLYVYYNRRTKRHDAVANKKQDPVIVDVVIPIGQFETGTDVLRVNVVLIKLREPRNAVIGDKFSSRHGQKGTLSRLWPHEDMPFSDSGIVPDILINPHAFPSRMTVGMLLESMAGKAGAIHGLDQDGTPFMFSEDDTAVDYFGKQLLGAGYSYHGSESMYSGIFGTELTVQIFMGVVFYQRLRHMVGDKFQARSEGTVNALTHQV
jgi:DNA-directed RNA polymerase I subunit RPA2